MKTNSTPTAPPCDDKIIVYFPEMISLLMGKDAAARQAFRNDVLQQAAEIRMRSRMGKQPSTGSPKIVSFPMGYPCSA